MREIPKVYKIFVLFLALLGVVFSSLLLHEGIHIATSETPISLCYNFQNENWMHVTKTISENDMSNPMSEKLAYAGQGFSLAFVSFFLGLWWGK